jgi:hypothetical protein
MIVVQRFLPALPKLDGGARRSGFVVTTLSVGFFTTF